MGIRMGWFKEKRPTIISGSIWIAIIYLLMSYNNSPVERFIKLSPEKRSDRMVALRNIDSIINTCKKLNRKYTPQKPFVRWYEGIDSFGEWYQPRLSNPIVKVIFAKEDDEFEDTSYCEVALSYSPKYYRYSFYNYEVFEVGEDQYGQTHFKSYKDDMCDDWGDRSCTK